MPLSATQDLDARFAVFLNPIKDLTKNWEVDISKYLEEYLEELAEIRITFDGGETVMNFAEAAMLIQGSAAVYGKKVEFLWQMVLQMLDLLSGSRKYNERGDDNQSEQPSQNASKGSPNSKHEFNNVDISHGRHINMKEEEANISDNISFKILPQIPLHLIDKEGEKSTMKIMLYLKNSEIFGNKEDYRINRSYLTPSGLLCLDLPQELLSTREKNVVDFANISIAGFLTQQAVEVLQPDYMSNPPEEVLNLMDLEEEPDLMPPDMDEFEPIGEGFRTIDRDNNNCSINNQLREEIISTKELAGTRSSNRKAASEPKKVELFDPWKPLDPHKETPAMRPMRAGRIRKPLLCSCHTPSPKKRKRRKVDENEIKNARKLPTVDSFIAMELASLVTINNTKTTSEMVKSSIMEEIAMEDLKRADIKKAKLLPKSNELDHEKDDWFSAPMEDNGLGINESMDDVDLPDPHEEFELADSPIGDVDPPKTFNDSLFYEPASDYEALVQKWVSEYVSSAQEHVSSTDLTKRVNKWRKRISPVLEKEEKRSSFDIHSYGSHVLNFFPKDNITDTCLFEDIVRNEDAMEVSRIFLSCLMLANTSNIELTEYKEGPLEMDCLEMRLLSRVRHHKQLEEYAAPSRIHQLPNRRKRDKRKPVFESSSSEDESSRHEHKRNKRNPR